MLKVTVWCVVCCISAINTHETTGQNDDVLRETTLNQVDNLAFEIRKIFKSIQRMGFQAQSELAKIIDRHRNTYADINQKLIDSINEHHDISSNANTIPCMEYSVKFVNGTDRYIKNIELCANKWLKNIVLSEFEINSIGTALHTLAAIKREAERCANYLETTKSCYDNATMKASKEFVRFVRISKDKIHIDSSLEAMEAYISECNPSTNYGDMVRFVLYTMKCIRSKRALTLTEKIEISIFDVLESICEMTAISLFCFERSAYAR